MKWAWLALLLVAATVPQLQVHLQITPSVSITSVQATTGADPTWLHGDWKLNLLDSNQNVVAQTTFTTSILPANGSAQTVPDIWVGILSPASGQTLQVIDPSGKVVATRAVGAVCGDGRCAPGEENTCPQDCPVVAQAQQAAAQEQTAPSGLPLWKILVLVGAGVLILALILVLLHINRKPPVKMNYDGLRKDVYGR